VFAFGFGDDPLAFLDFHKLFAPDSIQYQVVGINVLKLSVAEN
jgi:hypothetical protein